MAQQNIAVTATTAGAGDTTILAAVTGQKIRVVGFMLASTTQITIQFYSNASPTTPLTGPLSVPAVTPFTLPVFDRHGAPGGAAYWFETNAGEALVLHNNAAGTVGGIIVVDVW